MRRLPLVTAASLALALGAWATAAPDGRGARAPSFTRIAFGFAPAVYVTSAPGDASTLYVVVQTGTIEIVRGGRDAGTFLDLTSSVLSDGEHGLLSVAFHPAYAQNHRFYVDYTDLRGDTHVVELRSENGIAVPSSARELLFVEQPYPNHKGGQLAFDRQGLLYVGMGDGGTNPASGPTSVGDPENRAQNPESRLGKLLRIDPLQPGAAWEAVGYGLRNPWRFSFDRQTGDLWIGDVGAARSEEVDVRPAALLGTLANYGWSRWEGRLSYNPRVAVTAGQLVAPVWVYTHDYGGCGVIGGYVYRGTRVPSLRGRYVFGDLCTGAVWSAKRGKNGLVPRVTTVGARIPGLTSFGEDANGELYAVGLNGALYTLR